MKAGNTGHISNVLGTQLPTLGLKPPEEQLWPEQFLIAGVFLEPLVEPSVSVVL